MSDVLKPPINEQIFSDDALIMRTVTNTPYVLDGIVNKLFVLIEIKGKERELDPDKQRNPMELSIVLDRSGSMHGEKLENSKAALIQMIDNLLHDDVLHVVQYDDTVQTVFKNGNLKQRRNLVKKIEQIASGGSTNLMGGVLQGFNEIDKGQKNTKTKRIFLFSDGLVNVGVTDPDQIYANIRQMRSKGVNISSFGIGTDFDEDLMTAIAEVGGGDYFFINGADTIPEIVAEGLGGLLKVVGSNAILKVRGLAGCTVTKMYGYDIQQGADLGDIKSGEVRQFLVEAEVKPGSLTGDVSEFLMLDLQYNPIDDLTSTVNFQQKIHIRKTTDENLLTEENEEVMVLKSLLDAAEKEKAILRELELGNFEEALQQTSVLVDELQGIQEKVADEKNIQKLTGKLQLLKQSKKRTKKAKESGRREDQMRSIKGNKYSSYQTVASKQRSFIDDDEE